MNLKHYYIVLIIISCVQVNVFASAPDSVYLFSYNTTLNNNKSGLHFAWSNDRTAWHTIGREYSFLKSDYGSGRTDKKMFSQSLMYCPDGTWYCIWQLNSRDSVFAYSTSHNLSDWGRQNYIPITPGTTFQDPLISFSKLSGQYLISFRGNDQQFWQLTSRNRINYSLALKIPNMPVSQNIETVTLPSGRWKGQIHRVSWKLVESLIRKTEYALVERAKKTENTLSDSSLYSNLKTLQVKITANSQQRKPISDMLTGIFFEDINYSADGGLYAELVQNRGFEYTPSDKLSLDTSWNSKHSWYINGNSANFSIDTKEPLHPNNPHYGLLDIKVQGAALVNTGFDGISVNQNEKYRISLFAKLAGQIGQLEISVVSKDGKIIGKQILSVQGGHWKKYETELITNETADGASLHLKPLFTGQIALDMISLFPMQTYKGRVNGMRKDLSEVIAAIKPKFLRFPGGCVAHGDGLKNIYRWKNTIGPLEARKPQRNIWNYHQSVGLGYHEYFLFCEDLGAAPLPVVAAGVSCQNSGVGGSGQQGGIPMSEMDEYVQDVLDLVQYANGPLTSKWGKLRAQAGHPKPFGLKYIGIGNEDLISDVFAERFKMIFNAMQKKHPEIIVIGTVGPFQEGNDYVEGWKLADSLKLPMVDEHYYQPPGWFINHQDFYDAYDRSKSKVYLGEYASQGNTWFNALAESLYMNSLERNGDVVSMTSYAPLLAKRGRTQWNPDLIYFTNREVSPTVNYEIQKLYGQNVGDIYIPSVLSFSNTNEAISKRFGVSITQNALTKNTYIKLTNVLPVTTEVSLDLSNLLLPNSNLFKRALQASPAEKSVVVKTEGALKDCSKISLPPYSVTLITATEK